LWVEETVFLDDNHAPSFAVVSLATSAIGLAQLPAGMAVGDEVMLMNRQGSPEHCAAVGTYEFLEIAALDATVLHTTTPIAGIYGADSTNGNLSGQHVVAQRVPHFSTVTVTDGGVLTAAPWDGARGGVLVMRVADTLSVLFGGCISADALGFRGGQGWVGDDERHGRQGESVCGNPQTVAVTPNDGGGGGGYFMAAADDPCGQGGGGAGYGQVGTWTDFTGTCRDHGNTDPAENGGQSYGTASLERLYLGSGGGSGGTDDHSPDSGTGGRGGGIVLFFANHLQVAGLISARGGGGGRGEDTTDSGNGGGGSGGTILFSAGIIEGSGWVLANGGAGLPSLDDDWNNGGGDGGVGRIRLNYQEAGGYLYGRTGAATYLDGLCWPHSGPSELYLE
jgi:hypothetical protein